jgi:hypothetical protein
LTRDNNPRKHLAFFMPLEIADDYHPHGLVPQPDRHPRRFERRSSEVHKDQRQGRLFPFDLGDRKQHPSIHDARRGQHRHPTRFDRDDMDIPKAAGKFYLDHGLRTQGKGCLTSHSKQPLSESPRAVLWRERADTPEGAACLNKSGNSAADEWLWNDLPMAKFSRCPLPRGDCLPQRAASRQPQLHRPEAGVLLLQIHML